MRRGNARNASIRNVELENHVGAFRSLGLGLQLSLTLVLLFALVGCSTPGKVGQSMSQDSANTQLNDTLSQKEIAQIETVNERLEEMRTAEGYIDSGEVKQAQMALRVVNELAADGLIDTGSILHDEDAVIITYVLSSGVLACEKIGGFAPDVDGSENLVASNDRVNDEPVTQAVTDSKIDADGLILFAMNDRPVQYNRCLEFEESWDSVGIETSVDNSVTLDDMADLSDYEFVYTKMHGIYTSYRHALYWVFGYESVTTSFICLEQKQSSYTDKIYEEDLTNHRIGYINGLYMVAPDFFDAHYSSGDLDGNIFFLGCCELMGRDGNIEEAWTYAFKNASLAAFVGFHNSNFTDYNLDLVQVFMNRLIEGDSARVAFDIATDECGENDEIWSGVCTEGHIPAYPLLRGNQAATLEGVANSPLGDPSVDDPSSTTAVFIGLPEFTFSSGAGAWGTEVKIHDDGTFTGYYSDWNAEPTGNRYPAGTRYECHFSGEFVDVEKISGLEYSFKLGDLDIEGTEGEEEINDGLKVITSGPYGFDNASEFRLYLPGRNTADLPSEYLGWVSSAMGEMPTTLPFYGLYNMGGKQGFYSSSTVDDARP